jgi:hypothetical protein
MMLMTQAAFEPRCARRPRCIHTRTEHMKLRELADMDVSIRRVRPRARHIRRVRDLAS